MIIFTPPSSLLQDFPFPPDFLPRPTLGLALPLTALWFSFLWQCPEEWGPAQSVSNLHSDCLLLRHHQMPTVPQLVLGLPSHFPCGRFVWLVVRGSYGRCRGCCEFVRGLVDAVAVAVSSYRQPWCIQKTPFTWIYPGFLALQPFYPVSRRSLSLGGMDMICTHPI